MRQIWLLESKSAELSIMTQISKNIKSSQEKMAKKSKSKEAFLSITLHSPKSPYRRYSTKTYAQPSLIIRS